MRMKRGIGWMAAGVAGLLLSCVGAGGGPSSGEAAGESAPLRLIASVWPVYGTQISQGDTVRIAYKSEEGAVTDSVVLSVHGERLSRVDSSGYLYTVRKNHPTGRLIYTLKAYRDGSFQQRTGEFTVLAAQPARLYGHKVKAVYPHDRGAYTQGLLWHDGALYESTGVEGQSSLRRVDLTTGEVLQNVNLPRNYFGEGLVLLGDKLYQLTWQNNKALVYDRKTFEQVGEFDYPGEGWGLATDGKLLYMSDGSEKIRVLDPATFKPLRTLEVYTDQGKLLYINEMEWINGQLWANVYTTDKIVRIDPATGAVLGVIDMSGLLSPSDIAPQTDVFNGIAYDAKRHRIFVTGKYWNKLFEVEIFEK